MGYPGALPVPNSKAVEMALMLGIALNGDIQLVSDFSRKNYFYPDLPKGYQITQDSIPIIKGGYITIREDSKVSLERMHLEEDSAKMIHETGDDQTYIDFNRAGIPLLEIVTYPCIHSHEDAGIFLEKLKQVVSYLKISTGKMEEGALRCDVNVSISRSEDTLGQKVEVKNLNSFRSVMRSIQYEVYRQTEYLEKGLPIIPETRTWNDEESKTVQMRVKDSKSDYRYFPEPDLRSLVISEDMIENAKSSIPELPQDAYNRLITVHGLSEYDAQLLTASPDILQYFDECIKDFSDPKTVSNWISSELMKIMNDRNCSIFEIGISPKKLQELLKLIQNETISGKIAKDLLLQVIQNGKNPSDIVKEQGLLQVTDDKVLHEIVEKVLQDNPQELERYHAGEEKLFGMFMGACMKATKGKGNPKLLTTILRKALKK
jgi:aspartyl-tRNA(Asn)/glutamyl-tRNA(Gln) amidotransferase subunit B